MSTIYALQSLYPVFFFSGFNNNSRTTIWAGLTKNLSSHVFLQIIIDKFLSSIDRISIFFDAFRHELLTLTFRHLFDRF